MWDSIGSAIGRLASRKKSSVQAAVALWCVGLSSIFGLLKLNIEVSLTLAGVPLFVMKIRGEQVS